MIDVRAVYVGRRWLAQQQSSLTSIGPIHLPAPGPGLLMLHCTTLSPAQIVISLFQSIGDRCAVYIELSRVAQHIDYYILQVL